MKTKYILLTIICFIGIVSCQNDDNTEYEIPVGNYNHTVVNLLKGFGEEKEALFAKLNVSEGTFIALSTAAAWTLQPAEQTTLKDIRNGVSKPDEKTLLQKVIPLEDMSIYMDNIYGGTIGGFVAEAADVKLLINMFDVYWGLRLDYEGTKFDEDGSGYAVIRFYSNTASQLTIPFSPELGGTQAHAWPNGGGGFTTSTLGKGGYPEWVCSGYNVPEEGAELYEVSTQGQEHLRSIFKEGKWQAYGATDTDISSPTRSQSNTIRNGVFDGKFITTYGEYKGYTFTVRGEVNGFYHLTTDRQVPVAGLQVVEKGIYGVQATKDTVKNVHEVAISL